ncbi:MAG: PorP/SprF family type IX secretion system membrane protein [Bacteroidales bacterium]
MKKLLYSMFIVIYSITKCFGQDISFAQHEQSDMLINPALTGNFKGHARGILQYKNQWKHIVGSPYKTYAASIDATILNTYGLGIQFLKDQTGINNYSTNQINSSFSLQTNLNKNNTLGFGIQLSWTQKFIDLENQTWNSQYDGLEINTSLASGEEHFDDIQYLDVSAGWIWKYTNNNKYNIDIGVGAYHLSRPKYTQYIEKTIVPIRWTGIIDIDLLQWQNSQLTYHPSVIIENQDYQNNITIGGYSKIKFGLNSKYTGFYKNSYFRIGGYYTVNNCITSYLRLDYYSVMSLTFTYDFIISDLATRNTKGGSEISLTYFLK